MKAQAPIERDAGARRAEMRLFESDALERLTRTKPATVPLLWVPLSSALFAWGASSGLEASEVAWLASAAVLVWTLFEYTLHRVVFHLDRLVPRAARFCFMMHGSHHLDPNDAGRRLTPPVVSLPIFAVVLGIARAALGQDEGLVFAGVFGLSYVAYDMMHYACHAWRLPGRIGAYLKRHHLAHHYVDDHRNFGVTSPVWDAVFGTLGVRARRG